MNKISFCGIDDNVDINKLIEISKTYSGVEWSVLLHPGREGTLRYPSKNTLEKFKKSGLNISCHLCGQNIGNIFNGDFTILKELSEFNRVQINATVENGINIEDYQTSSIINNLCTCIESFKNINWILQYNEQTKNYCSKIMSKNYKNVHILIDYSCGKGKYNPKFPDINYHTIGYAGGINNENIHKTC